MVFEREVMRTTLEVELALQQHRVAVGPAPTAPVSSHRMGGEGVPATRACLRTSGACETHLMLCSVQKWYELVLNCVFIAMIMLLVWRTELDGWTISARVDNNARNMSIACVPTETRQLVHGARREKPRRPAGPVG